MKKAPNPTMPGMRPNSRSAMRSMRARAGGFTLMELMITIAVLGIMVGIGIPSFQDMMRRNRLAAQTNTFIGALAIARSEAVKRGVLVTVCPADDPIKQDRCGPGDDWASNGLIVFTDGFGSIGVIDADADDDEEDDAIIQRIAPSAPGININNKDDVNLISYRPDGSFDMAAGAELEFIIAPEKCRDPDGARSIKLITAGRASPRKINCPVGADAD